MRAFRKHLGVALIAGMLAVPGFALAEGDTPPPKSGDSAEKKEDKPAHKHKKAAKDDEKDKAADKDDKAADSKDKVKDKAPTP